jgi:hypothetical protein
VCSGIYVLCGCGRPENAPDGLCGRPLRHVMFIKIQQFFTESPSFSELVIFYFYLFKKTWQKFQETFNAHNITIIYLQ